MMGLRNMGKSCWHKEKIKMLPSVGVPVPSEILVREIEKAFKTSYKEGVKKKPELRLVK